MKSLAWITAIALIASLVSTTASAAIDLSIGSETNPPFIESLTVANL